MKLGIILVGLSFFLLSSYKFCVQGHNDEIFGTRTITNLTYSKYGHENNPMHFLHPGGDTIEAYQKIQNMLYKRNVFFTYKNGKTVILHRYIFFKKNSNHCLYYDQSNKENGYTILNKDSVMSSNFITSSNIVDTSELLPGLRNSIRIYNKSDMLVKEIIAGASKKCNNRNDTLIYYYATEKIPVSIQLNSYVDSIRKQTVIKYEGIVCTPDTTNTDVYRIRAYGELQTLGIIKKNHYIFKVFTEMEKKYTEMIKNSYHITVSKQKRLP
jgi:hypothetical protein